MVDKIDREEMASNYGFALAFMHSDPELRKLFNQAVKQTWTVDRFIAKLRNTDWFQHTSSTVRQAIMQETSDPATYQANVDKAYSHVRDVWGQMFGKANINNKDLKPWAETAMKLGWTDAEIVDHLTKTMNFKKLLHNNSLGGAAAQTEGQLRALTQAYGVDLGNQWRANQVKRIISGDDTVEGVRSRVQELAMREYKAFADQIAGGQTVADIADPYRQKMASLLELNPNDISLSDKTIQKALKQRTADGKPAAMDFSDFEDFVRKDKRWQYTDNAREQMSALVASLGQSFGVLA